MPKRKTDPIKMKAASDTQAFFAGRAQTRTVLNRIGRARKPVGHARDVAGRRLDELLDKADRAASGNGRPLSAAERREGARLARELDEGWARYSFE